MQKTNAIEPLDQILLEVAFCRPCGALQQLHVFVLTVCVTALINIVNNINMHMHIRKKAAATITANLKTKTVD